MGDVATEKRTLRATMRRWRDSLEPADRAGRSRAACDLLARLPELGAASVVAGFVATRSEVDPAEALAAARGRGAIVVAPRVHDRARPRLRFHAVTEATPLRSGAFGVAEPPADAPEVPAAALGVVVLPGLAFDERGGRLGYGGGYYDELLAAIAPLGRATLVGLAFDEQIVARCPMELGDGRVHMVVTDARVIRCAGDEQSRARHVA